MRALKTIGKWALFLLAPAVVGALAFFFSAKVVSSARGLVAVALVSNLLVAYACARLAVGKRAPIAAAIATGLFAIAGWALLFRRPPLVTAPIGDRGVAFERWELPTGSRLAVARINKGGSAVPVVFLHGGPGRPVFASDVAFFRTVADAGLDVVLFDQAGVGESDALPRRELTVERAVSDIEAVRQKLGVEKISIIGQSWGGRLGYEYAAKFPARVDRLAFIGGAPLVTDGAQWKFDERRTGLSRGGGKPFPPAIIAAVLLQRINPGASESFASRDELTALMANFIPTVARRSVCAKDDAALHTPEVAGLDGSQFLTVRDWIEKNPAPAIAAPPRTLVLRGECDYVQWRTARDYRDRLHGKLVYIAGAGHALWPYRADMAKTALAAFFRGEPVPFASYDGEKDPAGD
jgi:pimeloyl-ACP methyl ester carboxylesterase